MELYRHQKEALEFIRPFKKCLLAHEMGSGKTWTSTEAIKSYGDIDYIIVVAPKSLIPQWVKHFRDNYDYNIVDYTKPKAKLQKGVILINYDLIWRRPEILSLNNYLMICDEATALSNWSAKRTKAIMRMHPENLILLSGSISKGKIFNLHTIVNLLGYKITKKSFWDRYVVTREIPNHYGSYPLKIPVGAKNTEELKRIMIDYGTHFVRTDDVLDLPEKNIIDVSCPVIPEYDRFLKDKVITIDGDELIGDSLLSELIYARMLCGHYNKHKIELCKDLINSTEDRLLIFCNFKKEIEVIRGLTDKPISVVTGDEKDLTNYDKYDNSVTLLNFQAASQGLNLQKANKIIYFTPSLSCDNYVQSMARIRRINQIRPCYYYRLICDNSVEDKIYKSLEKGADFTERLYADAR